MGGPPSHRAFVDKRSLIHDTQADTDRSYDLIADTLLCQRMPDGKEDLPFPNAALFLATHNAASATKAIATRQDSLKAFGTVKFAAEDCSRARS
jgi:proline dehydrogenase